LLRLHQTFFKVTIERIRLQGRSMTPFNHRRQLRIR
jgi:hypothetical protein